MLNKLCGDATYEALNALRLLAALAALSVEDLANPGRARRPRRRRRLHGEADRGDRGDRDLRHAESRCENLGRTRQGIRRFRRRGDGVAMFRFLYYAAIGQTEAFLDEW